MNEEVITIKEEIIKNTGCVIGNVSTQELQENARKNLTMLIQALTTPKISEEGKFGSGHHKLFVKNKKYKQLLDKIELEQVNGWEVIIVNGNRKVDESGHIYNILKELKSIGGNK